MKKTWFISLLLTVHGIFYAAEAARATAVVGAGFKFAPDVTEAQKAAFPVVARLIVNERSLQDEVDNFVRKFYRDICSANLYFKESFSAFVDKFPADMSDTKIYHNELVNSACCELSGLGRMKQVMKEYPRQGIANIVEDCVALIARSRGYLRAAHKNLVRDKKNNHDRKLESIESLYEDASVFLEKHTVPKWVRRADDRNSITISFCQRRYLHRRLTYELAAVVLGEHLDGLKFWAAETRDLWLQLKKLAEARSRQSADTIRKLEVTLDAAEQSLTAQQNSKFGASKDIVCKMLQHTMDNTEGGEIVQEKIAKARAILLAVRKNNGSTLSTQIEEILALKL